MYHITLDPEPTEIVREWLSHSNLTFSGWLNSLMHEFAKAVKGQPNMIDKPVGEMTVSEFQKTVSYWYDLASKEE